MYCYFYSFHDNVDFSIRDKRAVNRSMTYYLCLDTCTYLFTFNQDYNLLFDKWLSQFPININLD